MPSRQNEEFLFLPDPILPGWLRILHLIELLYGFNFTIFFFNIELEQVWKFSEKIIEIS